jgi:hypothetical protein
MKKIISLAIALNICTFSVAAVTPVSWKKGKGTQDKPYQIESAEHLYYLSQQVQKGESFDNIYFLMTNDMDLQGNAQNQWTPIGNNSSPFKGHFDGNYFEIKNLFIDNPSMDYAGLFGYIHLGTVEKLGLSSQNFISARDNTGGIAGYQMGGRISECFNRSPVKGNNNVGGIVGYQYGTAINSCYNMGTIQGNWNIGGISGMGYGKTIINNCYNMGAILANNYKGGIAGKLDGYNAKAVIKNCYQESVFDKTEILGVGVAAEAVNCYYTDVPGMGTHSFGDVLSHQQMQSDTFVLALDKGQNVWRKDEKPYVNSRYPVLSSMKYEGLFTNEATGITTKAAVLNASFIAENKVIKEKGFEYKRKDKDEFIRIVLEGDSFSLELKELPPATYYIFRAFVITDKETLTGREVEFRTQLEQCGPNCGHHHGHDHNHQDIRVLPH